MKIHIVYGRAGSYEDTFEWNVKAFQNASEAEAFQRQLNDQISVIEEAAKAANIKYQNLNDNHPEIVKLRSVDPQGHLDDNSAYYYIDEIELQLEE